MKTAIKMFSRFRSIETQRSELGPFLVTKKRTLQFSKYFNDKSSLIKKERVSQFLTQKKDFENHNCTMHMYLTFHSNSNQIPRAFFPSYLSALRFQEFFTFSRLKYPVGFFSQFELGKNSSLKKQVSKIQNPSQGS